MNTAGWSGFVVSMQGHADTCVPAPSAGHPTNISRNHANLLDSRECVHREGATPACILPGICDEIMGHNAAVFPLETVPAVCFHGLEDNQLLFSFPPGRFHLFPAKLGAHVHEHPIQVIFSRGMLGARV